MTRSLGSAASWTSRASSFASSSGVMLPAARLYSVRCPAHPLPRPTSQSVLSRRVPS
jgi:hypothetical protein